MELSKDEAVLIPSRSLPYGKQLQYLLREFTSLSVELFTVYSSTSKATTSTAQIFTRIAEIDRQICQLLEWYDKHAKKRARIELLREKVEKADSAWRASTRAYGRALDAYEHVVTSNDDELHQIDQSEAAALKPETVLAYAKLLAPFTSAPPSSLVRDGQPASLDTSMRTLPFGAIPPFPTDQSLRQGRLQFKQESIEEAIGETVPTTATTTTVTAAQAKREQQEARDRLEAHRKAQEDEWELDLDLNPDM